MKQWKSFHCNEYAYITLNVIRRVCSPIIPLEMPQIHILTTTSHTEKEKNAVGYVYYCWSHAEVSKSLGEPETSVKKILIVKACTHPHLPLVWSHTVLNFIHEKTVRQDSSDLFYTSTLWWDESHLVTWKYWFPDGDFLLTRWVADVNADNFYICSEKNTIKNSTNTLPRNLQLSIVLNNCLQSFDKALQCRNVQDANSFSRHSEFIGLLKFVNSLI